MNSIEERVQTICELGATAIHRYAVTSGESLDDVPEYFLPAFIFNEARERFTTTLETRFSKLLAWNDCARIRRKLNARSPEEEAELFRLGETLGRPRVDMVLYEGDDEGRPKDKLDLWAIVEFKRYYLPSDERTKILQILPHIDTCPYGIVCGFVSSKNLEQNKLEAKDMGDIWFVSPLLNDAQTHFCCARLFHRSATP